MTPSDIATVLAKLPDTDIGTALQELSMMDPVIWCMFYRKLRGYPLVFDYSKQLTDASLAKLKTDLALRGKIVNYEREYKTRLLRHRPFHIQPMRDQHPHKVYEKARQIGVSELSISEVIWFLYTHPKTKWIYTFPRDSQLRDFVATRVAEAFIETPRMQTMLTGVNQIYTKRIGESYVIFRSAWESNLGEGIDADGVTLDEKDRMKDGVDIAFRESLSSSRFGYLREVSTPTLPGRGVDASFMVSDQQVWLMRCVTCNTEQEIEFPDNIVQVMDIPLGAQELPDGCYQFLCRKEKCRGLLNRLQGRWVPRYPSRKMVRGYHMPQTIAPWISATEVMQKKIKYRFFQLWANYVLGITAKGENALLTDDDFNMADAGYQRITRRTKDWTNISVGIDWGHKNWVVVMGQNVGNGRFYILNIGIFEDDHAHELASVKAIESFIAPYNPEIILADAGYGKDRNAYLLRKFGAGHFYAVWYNPSTKGSRTFQPVWSSPDQARLLVDRTMTIKVTCRAVKDREFGLPTLEDDHVQLLKKHFKNLAPIHTEEDGEILEEISCSGDDHLVHATGYAYLGEDALTKSGRFSFEFV